MTQLKSKICLVGEKGVGKSSLIRRFVQDMFDDRYLVTLGTKVSKKQVQVPDLTRGLVDVDMSVWDIMGEKGFRELLKDAYFFGANAVLAVADLTRKRTIEDLDDWIDGVYRVVGRIPIVLALNKGDLVGEAEIQGDDVDQFSKAFGSQSVRTSAKTGEGVQQAFRILGEIVVRGQPKLGSQPAAVVV